MDISEMDISETTSSNGIGIQICPFPICPFSDKPPFLPAPHFLSSGASYSKFEGSVPNPEFSDRKL
jgi:hypothetical protein